MPVDKPKCGICKDSRTILRFSERSGEFFDAECHHCRPRPVDKNSRIIPYCMDAIFAMNKRMKDMEKAMVEQARPQPPDTICDCDTPMGCVHSRMRVQPKVPMLSLSAITQIILLKKVAAEEVYDTDAEKQASIETLDALLEDIELAQRSSGENTNG